MEQGDRVICAISGGADSVALLWCLYLLREQLDLKLSAAHLNHGLRGEESDRDEDFVRQLCAGYQIPLTVGRTQVQAQGRGLEDAARRARYTFLESLDPAAKIATAHTADDNAETVLLHLIRGAGLRGLGGIAPARSAGPRMFPPHTNPANTQYQSPPDGPEPHAPPPPAAGAGKAHRRSATFTFLC